MDTNTGVDPRLVRLGFVLLALVGGAGIPLYQLGTPRRAEPSTEGRTMSSFLGATANLRVGDAERNQAADALSRHFAEGRLDQAEFDERVQAAMKAKTQADLDRLFTDLPRLAAAGPPARSAAARRPLACCLRTPLLAVVLVALLVGAVGHAVVHVVVAWWVVALVAFLILRRRAPR